MRLTNKKTQNSEKRHVANFLSYNLFCKKTLRPKYRLKSRIKKWSHNVTTGKKNIILRDILHRNL